jgi:hypothetical protein
MRFFDLILTSAAIHAPIIAAVNTSCRYLPGDANWPATKEWAALNTTVGGCLVATTPLGSPCHDPTYNATECTTIQSQWNDVQLQ